MTETLARSIRLFCDVGPRAPEGKEEEWWPDIAFSYASALCEIANVRILSTRAAVGGPGYLPKALEHWRPLLDFFSTPMGSDYANVVCVGAGHKMGTTIRKADLMGMPDRSTIDPGVHMPAPPVASGDPNEVIYEPKYALCSLWTQNVENVAITGYGIYHLTELEALALYNLVIVPDDECAKKLSAYPGLNPVVCPPSRLDLCLERWLAQ